MRINYSKENGIGRMELDHPPYNSLTSPAFEDYSRLKSFLSSQDIKGVLITGKGKHFCSGADLTKLKEQIKNQDDFLSLIKQGKRLIKLIQTAPVPTMAVIKGSCLGAGLEIALACCFRFSSENALLGFPEAEHGIMPGFGGSILGQEHILKQALVRLIISGKLINSREALSLGLVDRIDKTHDVESTAVEYLHRLTGNREPYLIRAILTSINNSVKMSLEEALYEESKLFYEVAKKAFKG
jgi:enoyl-CoA hydratase/carnithine racemase